MKRISILAFSVAACVWGAPASDGISLTQVKVQSVADVEGTFVRSVDGVEVFTFKAELCMVTFHPSSTAGSEGSTTMGATEASPWTVDDRGTVTVGKSALLIQPVVFALVKWDGGEGLLRLNDAGDAVPSRAPAAVLDQLIYRKEHQPKRSEETSGKSVPSKQLPGSPQPQATGSR